MSQLKQNERYYWHGPQWIIGPDDAKPGQVIQWAGDDYKLIQVDGKLRAEPVKGKR